MLGTIEGSAGGLTFASQNGLNILRQKVGKNNSKTLPQQKVRNQFKALARLYTAGGSAFLSRGLLKQGGKSSYNRFVGENYGLATSADALAVAAVDYTKLRLSSGAVLGVAGLVATAAANSMSVAYTANADGASGLTTDKVTVVVMEKLTGKSYSATGATRAAGPQVVAVPGLTAVGKAGYVVYAFFTRADGSDASPTAYAVPA